MDEIEKKEEWYLNIDYREAKEIIRNKLQGMTQNFIGRKAGTTDEIYDHQYIQYADSETYLVEFLKNLQKGEK